jgi:NAD(P)-dependent dehydrogenase (short-subunit alcohol dehydrogenase family)
MEVDMTDTQMETLMFAGKVALIAGASRGIGAATARAFAQAGASVVLSAPTSAVLSSAGG